MRDLLAGVTVLISGVALVVLGVLGARGHRIGVRRDDDLIETLRVGTPNWDLATEPLLPLLVEWRDEVNQP